MCVCCDDVKCCGFDLCQSLAFSFDELSESLSKRLWEVAAILFGFGLVSKASIFGLSSISSDSSRDTGLAVLVAVS